MRTEIPLLQNVRVASPCRASWEDMTPIDQDRVRFCNGCQKRVYNLSALCQAEAEGLLRAHEGHLCVRYYRRSDGTILTADCPVGLRAARQLVLTRARVSVGLCLMLCAAFAAHHATNRTMPPPAPLQETHVPTPDPVPLMGDIAEPAPPVPPTPMMGAIAAPARTEPDQGQATGAEDVGYLKVVVGEAAPPRLEVRQGRVLRRAEPEMGKPSVAPPEL